jgi:hypothetical protein
MTVAEQVTHDLGPVQHPLAPGASVEVIREHLLAEDRPQFDRELQEAEDADAQWDRVEHWRHVAVIQFDRDGFVAMVRRAAERNTGEPTPPGEDLEETRSKAGM